MARVPPQTVPLEPLHDQNRQFRPCGSVGFGPGTVRMARVPPDQKVASYEPLVPIYEVVKTALVACPIKVAVSRF